MPDPEALIDTSIYLSQQARASGLLALEEADIDDEFFRKALGVVQMLGSMNDPKQIAPAMAVALLTTLYGAMIANVVAIPIADKLALRGTDERLAKSRRADEQRAA